MRMTTVTKEYQRTRVLKSGRVAVYVQRQTYERTTAPLSPEVVEQIRGLVAAGVNKKRVSLDTGVSYYKIQQCLVA